MNWELDWSSGKQDWCCKHAGRACATTAPVPHICKGVWDASSKQQKTREWCCRQYDLGCLELTPYDCDAEWEDDWTAGKTAWCCLHEGRACPSSTSGPPLRHSEKEADFDCGVGYKDWESRWPESKKAWCCKHQGRGCSGGVAKAYEFACDGDAAGWSSDQKVWCCIEKGTCPGTSSKQDYDCEAAYSQWEQEWSPEKKSWCCEHAGRGCFEFDCKAGFVHWRHGWSGSKQKWCCANAGRGCSATQGGGIAAAAPSKYDCSVGFARWRESWSADKQAWCCDTAGRACHGMTSTLPFECDAGLKNWEVGWSDAKKTWCCKNARLGCPTTNEALVFDCDAGLANWDVEWSGSKKAWCCQRAGRGCPTTTAGLFDCDSGYDDFEEAWSIHKQAWCCERKSKGCPQTTTDPGFDCDAGRTTWAASWSVAKKIWCCEHREVGCSDALRGTSRSALPALLQSAPLDALAESTRRSILRSKQSALPSFARSAPSASSPIALGASSAPVLGNCPVNCFGAGADAVRLEGSTGRGDGAEIPGLSLESCRKHCMSTDECEGILFMEQPEESGKTFCFGKKNFKMSKCQPANEGVLTEVLKAMPYGQCAIVGDPHIITWDRTFAPAVVQTDPGDFWLVKSDTLKIMGRFGFTDRFKKASSATGVAVTGSLIKGHTLIVDYVGTGQGMDGFEVTWDGEVILKGLPSEYTSADHFLKGKHEYLDPSQYHREGRHTIGGTSGSLPSYLFDMMPELRVYVLVGPDNINIVLDAKKVPTGQDGYCGNFNCDKDDDSLDALRSRGVADPVARAESLFPDPPRAPRAQGDVPLHGGPAGD